MTAFVRTYIIFIAVTKSSYTQGESTVQHEYSPKTVRGNSGHGTVRPYPNKLLMTQGLTGPCIGLCSAFRQGLTVLKGHGPAQP